VYKGYTILTNDIKSYSHIIYPDSGMSRLQYLNLKLFIRQILTAGEIRILTRPSASTRHYSKLSNWGTKKSATHVKIINYHPEAMADPQVEQILAPLREAVRKQVSNRPIEGFLKKYQPTDIALCAILFASGRVSL